MQRLNQQSTQVFCILMDNLKEGYLKIERKPFMPLVLEQIGKAQLPPYGEATLFSLCHYYKKNGDLMQAPEMCFAVVDGREEVTDFDNVVVVPYMLQQADEGRYEESMQLEAEGFVSFNLPQQHQHVAFADDWLKGIREYGLLTGLASGDMGAPFVTG